MIGVRPHPGGAGPHRSHREPDGRAGPLAYRFPCRTQPLGEQWRRRDIAGGDQVRADAPHPPYAFLAHQVQVHHRDAGAVRRRLDEVDALEHRVADLPVRVAHHDDVGTGREARERGRRVLVPHTRRVVRGAAAEPRMGQGDDDVGVPPHGREHRCHGRPDRRHPDAAAELVAVPDHRAGSRDTGDRDADLLPLDDAIGRVEQGVAGSGVDVGTHVRKARVGDGAPEERQPPVEIVVARRRRVVARQVHRLHDRMRLGGRHAREVGGECVALQQVAGVHQHHLPREAGAERVDHRRDAGEAAGKRAIRHVVPVGDVAVKVGGGDEHDVRRILKRSGGEHERGEEGEHRGGIWGGGGGLSSCAPRRS